MSRNQKKRIAKSVTRRRLLLSTAITLALPWAGCVPVRSRNSRSAFTVSELDAALLLAVDMSGSYRDSWDSRAYDLSMRLVRAFFLEGAGLEYRIVIAQISGGGDVIVFDGTPADLRQRFSGPAALMDYLKEESVPDGSHVYASMETALRYMLALSGRTERTRLMVAAMSDMADSQTDQATIRASGGAMLEALKSYREAKGAIALYYVSLQQMELWTRLLIHAGYSPGQYVIASELEESPQLPNFE